jgi:hypothetical protein
MRPRSARTKQLVLPAAQPNRPTRHICEEGAAGNKEAQQPTRYLLIAVDSEGRDQRARAVSQEENALVRRVAKGIPRFQEMNESRAEDRRDSQPLQCGGRRRHVTSPHWGWVAERGLYKLGAIRIARYGSTATGGSRRRDAADCLSTVWSIGVDAENDDLIRQRLREQGRVRPVVPHSP